MERPKPKKVDEEAKSSCPCVGDSYYEKFPYGMRLTLRDEELKKLGLDVTKLKAGGIGTLQAKIIFTDISKNDHIDKEGKTTSDNRIEIQITDVGIEHSDKEFEDAFNDASAEENGEPVAESDAGPGFGEPSIEA